MYSPERVSTLTRSPGLDEQRDLDHGAGLQGRGLHRAGPRVALRAGVGLGDLRAPRSRAGRPRSAPPRGGPPAPPRPRRASGPRRPAPPRGRGSDRRCPRSMNTASVPSAYRNCIDVRWTIACATFTPALNVARSRPRSSRCAASCGRRRRPCPASRAGTRSPGTATPSRSRVMPFFRSFVETLTPSGPPLTARSARERTSRARGRRPRSPRPCPRSGPRRCPARRCPARP